MTPARRREVATLLPKGSRARTHESHEQCEQSTQSASGRQMTRRIVGLMWVAAAGALTGLFTFGAWVSVSVDLRLAMLVAAIAGAAFGFTILVAVWTARQLP
jgi:hypothetical protein